MNDQVASTPWGVFISAFGVASFAGLAALLRSGTALTYINVLSAIMNSGIMGLGIALLWYTKFQDNIYFLIGVCVLAGLGGASMVEFVVAAFKRGGLSVSLSGFKMEEAPATEQKNEKQ